jgi:hypothetical protein
MFQRDRASEPWASKFRPKPSPAAIRVIFLKKTLNFRALWSIPG